MLFEINAFSTCKISKINMADIQGQNMAAVPTEDRESNKGSIKLKCPFYAVYLIQTNFILSV